MIASGDLLVAGHQRHNALLSLGIKTAPVYFLPAGMSKADEVWFNQLHNATDTDTGDEGVVIPGLEGKSGFVTVSADGVTGNFRSGRAVARDRLCAMVAKYGSWGAVIALPDGEVLNGAQYALAAKLTKKPILVFVAKPEDKESLLAFLGRPYGVFSYSHLKRETFAQMMAQPPRIRSSGIPMASPLYDKHVIPWLQKQPRARIIDFGAGFGAYPTVLRKKGYHVDEIEFFRRVPGKLSVDVPEVNRMVDTLIREVGTNGLYDAVVCDVVLNAVDSPKAEDSVWTMLNALVKVGGMVFFSGRQREWIDAVLARDQLMSTGNANATILEFIDENGFSARFNTGGRGRWYYQRYHTRAEVESRAKENGLVLQKHIRMGGHTLGALPFVCVATKKVNSPWQKISDAVDFEFDILIGDDRNLGRNEDVKEVFQKVYAGAEADSQG